MLQLEPLSPDQLDALLAFEMANRAYFARFISDRGDAFYATFSDRHDEMLAEQDDGACAFYVLVDDRDGAIVGRFNLYDLESGAADVGYRVAEQVAGRGIATRGLRELCQRAADEHGLRQLRAGTSEANVASQRVLQHAGFTVQGSRVVGGKPGIAFAKDLTD